MDYLLSGNTILLYTIQFIHSMLYSVSTYIHTKCVYTYCSSVSKGTIYTVLETKRVYKRTSRRDVEGKGPLFQGLCDTPRRNCPHKS